MLIVGIVLIVIGVLELFYALSNGWSALVTTFAIYAMGFIIAGIICVCIRVAINDICDEIQRAYEKLLDNNKMGLKKFTEHKDNKLDYYDLPDSY